MRLIDADALADALFEKRKNYPQWVADTICGMPTIDVDAMLKEHEAVVHPEPSCEMTYITDCCCDLCGVQLIREDNFCRCCGKPIVWEGR